MAQVVECLPSLSEALGSVLHGEVCREEDYFPISFSYSQDLF
jgi:hypothetical protein